MLSIKINTKNFEILFNNINCPFLQAIWKVVLHYVLLVDSVGFLDTLEYF